MKPIFFIAFFYIISIRCIHAQQPASLLEKEDFLFLKKMTAAVLDSSRVFAGQSIAYASVRNNTNGTLIRPGGKDDYPSFWIRDYAMSLGCGLITIAEQKHMLLLTAATQCDQTWITKNGSIVPAGSIADHIRMQDSLPIYFPGTYSYEEQGNKEYGMAPPYCDQFYFIQLADYYVNSSGDRNILLKPVKGVKLIDRLELALMTVPSRLDNGIVYTTTDFRGVDFGFRDAITITGDLCFPSILKYQAAIQLSGLFEKINNKEKSKKYKTLALQIKAALPALFSDDRGMLRASTGISRQPDVWSTALAVYYHLLEGEHLAKACTTLAGAYRQGTLAFHGNIRHVLTSDDFSATTAWEKTGIDKNQYQNGAYWGTPVGWVCFAIAKADRQLAKQLAKEYISDLRANDFRKGGDSGAPYECFYPPDYHQNPLYLATVACPYIVFSSAF